MRIRFINTYWIDGLNYYYLYGRDYNMRIYPNKENGTSLIRVNRLINKTFNKSDAEYCEDYEKKRKWCCGLNYLNNRTCRITKELIIDETITHPHTEILSEQLNKKNVDYIEKNFNEVFDIIVNTLFIVIEISKDRVVLGRRKRDMFDNNNNKKIKI